MIKEYETTVSKIIYYDKKQRKKFLEDFREISLVVSLKSEIISSHNSQTRFAFIAKTKKTRLWL